MKKLDIERVKKLWIKNIYGEPPHTGSVPLVNDKCSVDIATFVEAINEIIGSPVEIHQANPMEEISVLKDLIRGEFHTRISMKTGWGKNEVMATLEVAMSDAFIAFLARKA